MLNSIPPHRNSFDRPSLKTEISFFPFSSLVASTNDAPPSAHERERDSSPRPLNWLQLPLLKPMIYLGATPLPLFWPDAGANMDNTQRYFLWLNKVADRPFHTSRYFFSILVGEKRGEISGFSSHPNGWNDTPRGGGGGGGGGGEKGNTICPPPFLSTCYPFRLRRKQCPPPFPHIASPQSHHGLPPSLPPISAWYGGSERAPEQQGIGRKTA